MNAQTDIITDVFAAAKFSFEQTAIDTVRKAITLAAVELKGVSYPRPKHRGMTYANAEWLQAVLAIAGIDIELPEGRMNQYTTELLLEANGFERIYGWNNKQQGDIIIEAVSALNCGVSWVVFDGGTFLSHHHENIERPRRTPSCVYRYVAADKAEAA